MVPLGIPLLAFVMVPLLVSGQSRASPAGGSPPVRAEAADDASSQRFEMGW